MQFKTVPLENVGVDTSTLNVSVPNWWVSTKAYTIRDTDEATIIRNAIRFFSLQIKGLMEEIELVNYDIDESEIITISQMDSSIFNLNAETTQLEPDPNNAAIDIEFTDQFFAGGVQDPLAAFMANNHPEDPFHDIEENFDYGCGSVHRSLIPSKLLKHVYIGPGENNDCFFEALHAHLQQELNGSLPYERSSIEDGVAELRTRFNHPTGAVCFVKIIEICNSLELNLNTFEVVDAAGDIWTRAISREKILTRFAGKPLNLLKTHISEQSTGAPLHHVVLVVNPDSLSNNIYCGRCSFWYTKQSKKIHEKKCIHCPKCNRPHNNGYDCEARRKREKEAAEAADSEVVEPPKKRQKRRSVQPPRDSKNSAVESYLHNKYFLDFETFTPPGGDRFVVYSYSIISAKEVEGIIEEFNKDKTYLDTIDANKYSYSGEDALEHCMQFIDTLPQDSTVITYNGSKFDQFFVFQHCVENSIEIPEILRKGKENKIITMRAGKNNVKYWDMCLFTFTSLARVCESVGVPKELQKQGFDHNRIKTWEDVFRLYAETSVYNFYDVLSLGVAYKLFGSTLAEEFNQDISECCTLSQLAYKIWTGEYMEKRMCAEISLPTSGDDYRWMRKALFGGRCQPQQKRFVSSQMETVMSLTDPESPLNMYTPPSVQHKKRLFAGLTDAKTYLDVSSLYPAASCMRNMYPMGKYKIVENSPSLSSLCDRIRKVADFNPMTSQITLSANKQKIVSLMYRSLFEVDMNCPNNINVPFVLERGPKGELLQNLHPKTRQVYDGVTIMMAQYLGYTVTRIYKRVTWEYLGTPLEKFMLDVYEKKSNAPKSSAAYMVWKLLMNSLTGKMSQQWISSSYSIHKDESSIKLGENEVLESHELINHSKSKEPIAIGATISNPTKMPSKPIQMGVWILSISRCMMMDMYLKMNLMFSTRVMSSYGDTDSFLPPFKAYSEAMVKHPNIFGEKLGLLADEISGGKIVRGWFISPKVYMVEYVTPDLKLKWKIRAKGIPRANKEIDAIAYKRSIKPTEELLLWHAENPLSRPLFSFSEGNSLTIADTLDDRMFDAMLRGLKVKCVYGSMKRRLVGSEFDNTAGTIVFEAQCYRTVNEKDWWMSGARSNPGDTMLYSVPDGHVDFKKMDTLM